jgi:Tol biopolymer transport system component
MRRRAILLLTTLVTALTVASGVALVASQRPATAAFPGLNGKIAFVGGSFSRPFTDVYVVNPNRSGWTNLTNDSADDSDPAVSPDARRIAFVSVRDHNKEIFVIDANGSNQMRLTDDPGRDFHPAFSADGSKIVFVSDRDGNQEIYVMGSDGSNPTPLTNSSANEEDPAFSPDGSKIAFTSDAEGNKDIYVMGLEGSDPPSRLTDDGADDYQPNWSPDGSKIAFTSERGVPPNVMPPASEIYVMKSDGSEQHGLTESVDPYSDSDSASKPAFSPDGSRIAYTSYYRCPPGELCIPAADATPECGQNWVHIMNADGSGRTSLPGPSDGGAYCTDSPDWGIRPSDTTPPDTTITLGPNDPTNDSTPTFSFSGSDDLSATANLRYSHKVDDRQWSSYSSDRRVTLGGTATRGLSDGAHTFYVKAKDEAGNEDATPARKTFTVDTSAPNISSVKPAKGATGVPRSTRLTADFSEAMDPTTLNSLTFRLYKWNREKEVWQQVADTSVSCTNDPCTTAKVDPYPSDPSRLLAQNTKFKAVITVGAKDEAGNPLAQAYVWSFNTGG